MTAKIAHALHAVMQACGYVQKTGKNAFHGYKYAGEGDLLDKLRPAMVEHGLLLLPSGKSVSPPDEHGNVTVAVEYTLAHSSGEIWPDKLVAFGCGNDRAKNGSVGDKGVYKALTGANKYLLFKLFQIETGDDPERDEVEPPPPAPVKPQPAPTPVELGITAKTLIKAIGLAKTQPELAQWFADNKGTIEGLHEDEKDEVRMVYAEHHATLKRAA